MDFYRIKEEYIDYLKNYETEKRGFTRVPNIRYADRNKFSFGAVLVINDLRYYVAVSSFSQKQEANILIRIPGDTDEVKGSLRFNYMIPVPEDCLERLVINEIDNLNYRNLLYKEYRFCQSNAERIQKKASKIYSMVINNQKQSLTFNSCDFKILESGCREYVNKNKENYDI